MSGYKPWPPKPKPKPGEGISLLVPFRTDMAHRGDLWAWLHRYWNCRLPGVEIVIGHDKKAERKFFKKPFSKTSAVNDAFQRSHGDVIVILDADAYIDEAVVAHCAGRIRSAVAAGGRMWFVPYRRIYRLTRAATRRVLRSKPCDPYRFPSPPAPEDTEGQEGSMYGHRYGALIQVMPREAFEIVGGMDCRFRGWGGEDVSFLRALDTLYTKHKNTPNDVLHLWHPIKKAGDWLSPQGAWWETRVWNGQKKPQANDKLAVKYWHATFNPEKMRKLVNEGLCACRPWYKKILGCHHKKR